MKNDFEKIEKKLLEITKAKTYAELAEKLGMTYDAYSGVRRRKTIPYEHIIEFCIKNNVDANAIFSDRREKYKIIKRHEIKKTDLTPYKTVGYYTHKAQLTQSDKTYEEVMLLPKEITIPEHAVAVRVFSDEMYPMLKNSDTIIIDQADTQNPNGIYLYIDDDLHLRLFAPFLDDPQKVKISCTNQIYQTTVEKIENLTIIGRLYAII